MCIMVEENDVIEVADLGQQENFTWKMLTRKARAGLATKKITF